MQDEIAKKIIAKNNYMVIATSDKNTAEPWITPVYYAYDEQNNFYWYSGKDTKHSQLIKQNDKVSIVIFDSSPAIATEDVYGVYMTGKAHELSEEEVADAISVYMNRAITNEVERKELVDAMEDFWGDSPLRMYKFVPEKVYISNEAEKWKGKWIDSRSEVKIS